LLNAVTNYFEVYHKSNNKEPKIPNISDFIFVRSDRRMKKINFSDILYIESYSDYLKVHCESEVIVTRETISTIESKLPQQQFMRTHRSYIVVISKIHSYSNEEITLKKKSIPISRNYKNEVLDRLKNL